MWCIYWYNERNVFYVQLHILGVPPKVRIEPNRTPGIELLQRPWIYFRRSIRFYSTFGGHPFIYTKLYDKLVYTYASIYISTYILIHACIHININLYIYTYTDKMWGQKYLSKQFFIELYKSYNAFKHKLVFILAYNSNSNRVVGGTFNVVSKTHFYGRYW